MTGQITTPGALRPVDGGATYSVGHRVFRLLWNVTWAALASWTPRQLHPWRRFLLKSFGARVGAHSDVRGSAKVWHPANLELGERAVIAEGVNCYNLDKITVGARALISQDAILLGGGHNIDSPDFDLITRPITIGQGAWIAAGAVIGPGVTVHPYAVLGGHAVAFKDLEAATIYVGNPARPVRKRTDWWTQA